MSALTNKRIGVKLLKYAYKVSMEVLFFHWM